MHFVLFKLPPAHSLTAGQQMVQRLSPSLSLSRSLSLSLSLSRSLSLSEGREESDASLPPRSAGSRLASLPPPLHALRNAPALLQLLAARLNV